MTRNTPNWDHLNRMKRLREYPAGIQLYDEPTKNHAVQLRRRDLHELLHADIKEHRYEHDA